MKAILQRSGYARGVGARSAVRSDPRRSAGGPRSCSPTSAVCNGTIHLGHAVNKVLKDIIVSLVPLDGYDAPIAGMGLPRLPIEMQVEKTHGRVGQKIDAKPSRACRATH